MGKAVYKIEIINISPFKDDITRLTKEVEQLRREENQKRETAEKAVNLVDLILQDLEHINEDPDINPDKNKLKAVKYCKVAYDILVKDKDNNIKLLQECLKYWIDVLARLVPLFFFLFVVGRSIEENSSYGYLYLIIIIKID